MRIRHLTTAAAVALLAALPASAQKKPLTLEEALGSGRTRVEYWSSPAPARWARDGVHYATRRDGASVWVDPESGEAKPAPASEPEPKETRPWTASVRNGNLHLTRTGAEGEWAVTTDGSDQRLYGVLDWVYQEELYGRGDFNGRWWNEDGSALAFLRLDEAEVKDFTVIDHVPPGALDTERAVVAEVTKYPKAGDPNPRAGLLVAWPETREVVEVDLSRYEPDVLIVRVGWTPDGRVLLQLQNRIQSWLDLATADPKTGAVTLLRREESKTWVNRLPFPKWLSDGSFLWLSERTGYQHVYHCDAQGKVLAAITSGDWQVREIVKVRESEGRTWIWFTGTKDGAIDNNLYRVALDDPKPERLTHGPGWHDTDLNGDGTWFLDAVSSITTPPELRLCKSDGSKCQVLDKAAPKDVATRELVATEQLSIPARDGYPLDATLMKPLGFDPAQRYPIYLPTYSGPDSPTVRNAFQASPWLQFLAQNGALVLQVNVRSASGRGQAHTEKCYKQLGVPELRDLEDAVDWVCAHAGGDPARVAIDGWSYGGFMAAYALTHSTKFSLGIAGGGVFDWRLYDTIYTERYMDTPQANPQGYDATSVIKAAKNLHGHLLIQHGVMDDNVHVQNALQLVHALQEANLDDFEMMLYPKSRHGVRGPHRRAMVWRALSDRLGLGQPAEAQIGGPR
jgi:dipeptidyl-peptidase-4